MLFLLVIFASLTTKIKLNSSELIKNGLIFYRQSRNTSKCSKNTWLTVRVTSLAIPDVYTNKKIAIKPLYAIIDEDNNIKLIQLKLGELINHIGKFENEPAAQINKKHYESFMSTSNNLINGIEELMRK